MCHCDIINNRLLFKLIGETLIFFENFQLFFCIENGVNDSLTLYIVISTKLKTRMNSNFVFETNRIRVSDIFQFFFFLAFCWVAKQFTVTHQKDSTKDVHGWKTGGAGDPKSQGRYTIFVFSCIFLQVFFNLSWGSYVKPPHLHKPPHSPHPQLCASMNSTNNLISLRYVWKTL